MCLYRSMVILMVLICLNAHGSEHMDIDLFEYAESSKAQEAWKPQAESPPVEPMDRKTDQGERGENETQVLDRARTRLSARGL